MLKKITFSMFLMAFSLSTFLSIPGIIPLIAEYFSVPITMASLFVALFALILSVTGLFLPSYFSKYERKRFFIISLSVFILSSFLQIFIDNFYLALIHQADSRILLFISNQYCPDSNGRTGPWQCEQGCSGRFCRIHIGIVNIHPYRDDIWICICKCMAPSCQCYWPCGHLASVSWNGRPSKKYNRKHQICKGQTFSGIIAVHHINRCCNKHDLQLFFRSAGSSHQDSSWFNINIPICQR